jgi:hypothetical protein
MGQVYHCIGSFGKGWDEADVAIGGNLVPVAHGLPLHGPRVSGR